MNIWLASAGVASLLTCGIHVVMGEREIHVPMLDSKMHPTIIPVWTVVWHMVSVLLAMNGIWLLLAASDPALALAYASLPIATSVATAGLFLFYGIKRLGNIWMNPQWVLFVAIAGLGLIGLTR